MKINLMKNYVLVRHKRTNYFILSCLIRMNLSNVYSVECEKMHWVNSVTDLCKRLWINVQRNISLPFQNFYSDSNVKRNALSYESRINTQATVNHKKIISVFVLKIQQKKYIVQIGKKSFIHGYEICQVSFAEK